MLKIEYCVRNFGVVRCIGVVVLQTYILAGAPSLLYASVRFSRNPPMCVRTMQIAPEICLLGRDALNMLEAATNLVMMKGIWHPDGNRMTLILFVVIVGQIFYPPPYHHRKLFLFAIESFSTFIVDSLLIYTHSSAKRTYFRPCL